MAVARHLAGEGVSLQHRHVAHTRADPLVAFAGVTGGVIAITVSLALLVTLPIRDVGYNALNLFTIVLATAAGLLTIRGARREDGSGLGSGSFLLFVAMVPTVFGWVVFLYLVSWIFVLVAVVRFITARD